MSVMYDPLDKNGCDQAWLYNILLPVFGVVCFMDSAMDVSPIFKKFIFIFIICPIFAPLLSAVIPCDFCVMVPSIVNCLDFGGVWVFFCFVLFFPKRASLIFLESDDPFLKLFAIFALRVVEFYSRYVFLCVRGCLCGCELS